MTVHATSIQRSTEIGPLSVTTQTSGSRVYRHFVKRLLDIFLVALSLPFVVPFMALLSVLIAFDGASPFFRQERIGKDGRRFVIWKFRTMVPDAENHLHRHLENCEFARHEWSTKQKLSSDPRVTRIGAALRRTSMDELPQLINVLKGDMSLIGPRPMMPSQQALYPGGSYYNLRPGMTGMWQVSARHQSEFVERGRYDDAYFANVSFLTDLRILAKTVIVVLRGTGV